MHLHRLTALAGVIIGVVGLFFSGLTTAGEAVLPALSQQSDSFPDGIPTIWGGLATWAQIVLVILIIVVVALAFMPERNETYPRMMAVETAVIGVALLAYAVVKYMDAVDSADTLEAGFAQAAAAEIPNIQAWTVSPSVGFFVLMLGTVLVALGGLMSLLATSE
ncbi:MAG: hypothetical protein HKN91_16380 [Acidimicrobiia bacterium]|nr:hypothetical protein [Acidimicrobiia bacterium]